VKKRTDILDNEDGSTLVEFSLLMGLIFLLTFGIVEAGYIYYQFNSAQKATQIGARYASTHASILPGMEDCGVTTSDVAGTDCVDLTEDHMFTPITCSFDTGGQCDATAWDAIFDVMNEVYPNLEKANVDITYSPTGLGFVGRGRPVPAITVTLKNLSYNYIAVGALVNTDLGSALNFNTTNTTIIAEDIKEGI